MESEKGRMDGKNGWENGWKADLRRRSGHCIAPKIRSLRHRRAAYANRHVNFRVRSEPVRVGA